MCVKGMYLVEERHNLYYYTPQHVMDKYTIYHQPVKMNYFTFIFRLSSE